MLAEDTKMNSPCLQNAQQHGEGSISGSLCRSVKEGTHPAVWDGDGQRLERR